ncbi:MAG: transglutaminase domain-containing protein [Lachnospiraceae bacterium]
MESNEEKNTAPVQEEESLKETVAEETVKEADDKKKSGKKTKKGGNGLVIGLLAVVVVMLAVMIALIVVVMNKDSKSDKRIDELASAVAAVSATTETYQETLSEMNEQIVQISDFTTRLSALMGEEETGASSENDVLIGGEYMIKSTEAISDAYKSGDTSGLDEDQIKTMELAAEVIDEVIEEGMTDYEKEEAIYNWIYENIKHDDGITVLIPTTGSYADNPKGVLTYKKAVCVGFATTFRLFMQMLDIECMVVHDTYLSHSWDLVKLDGNWYHTDLYMDAEGVRYANFNMTDEMCAEGHDWDTNFFPNATSVEYCYAVVNGQEFESLEATAESLRDLIEGGRSDAIFYKVTGDDKYIVYQQLEIMLEEVDQYVMNSEIGEDAYLYWSGYMADEDTLIFNVQFECYNNDYDYDDDPDYQDITDEDLQDAYDAVENAFKDFYDEHNFNEWNDDWDGDWDFDWDYDYDDDFYYEIEDEVVVNPLYR